mmetsp:Transcript_5743/g.17946  ORF Transcript_5743/g.17946 Transcript_5743/m.17946 type:complete len:245 (+) Transcript_5743:1079-1813(+)
MAPDLPPHQLATLRFMTRQQTLSTQMSRPARPLCAVQSQSVSRRRHKYLHRLAHRRVLLSRLGHHLRHRPHRWLGTYPSTMSQRLRALCTELRPHLLQGTMAMRLPSVKHTNTLVEHMKQLHMPSPGHLELRTRLGLPGMLTPRSACAPACPCCMLPRLLVPCKPLLRGPRPGQHHQLLPSLNFRPYSLRRCPYLPCRTLGRRFPIIMCRRRLLQPIAISYCLNRASFTKIKLLLLPNSHRPAR